MLRELWIHLKTHEIGCFLLQTEQITDLPSLLCITLQSIVLCTRVLHTDETPM